MANSLPFLSGLSLSVTLDEEAVNLAPQLIDADVTFVDADNNFDGGTLVLSGLLSEDIAAIRNEGTAAGQIGIDGANVTYEGVVIGTASGGAGGVALSVAFNAQASSVSIDALIQNLTYQNLSDTPVFSRTLELTITDAAGAQAVAPVVVQEVTGAANPFDGIDVGLRSTPSFADLDGDGDLDAVSGDLYGTLNYYENTGSSEAPVYVERTGAANPFDGIAVGLRSTPSFADLDGDGDLDAVAGETYGTLKYFENTGSSEAPVYVERTGAVNPFDGIDVGFRSTPSFADLDGDGDLDAVSGEFYGTLKYFENTGSSVAPVYVERTGAANPFDGIDVGDRSTPSFADLDGDGDLDAVSGEFDGALKYFENTGSSVAPVYVERTGAANPFAGIDVGLRSTPSFADLDGDGDLDAVVGEHYGTLKYFENTGSSVAPVYVEGTGAANPFNGIDVGLRSTPSFADLDGDGDLDAVAGETYGTLKYFENTGSSVAPVYVERAGAANPFAGIDVGAFCSPSFADLDGDGDLDAVSGEFYGTLKYFENTGTGVAPVYEEQFSTDNPFDGMDVSYHSAPAFADLDGDGDLDAVSGEKYGTLNYYENTGSSVAPVYVERIGTANPFNGMDVGYHSAPAFADLDGDGDLDAVSGAEDGVLNYYENTGTGVAPVYVARTGAANPFDGIDVGLRSTPSFADLDGDGDLDAVVGENDGTLKYFENTGPGGFKFVFNVTLHADPSAGADVMNGTGGADTIDGLGGNDTLAGGAGNDTLTGGYGIDSLVGGGDDDTYFVSATGTAGVSGIVFVPDAVSESAGGGIDWIYSDSSFTLPAEAENLALFGAAFWRAYVGIGNELDNVIIGEGAARHRLNGEGGADTLDGGAGADVLDGGAGADVLFGGSGDDVLVWDAADTLADGGAEEDTLKLSGAGIALDLAGFSGTVIQAVEIVDLTGAGDNTLTLTLPDVLAISSTTDTLRVDGNSGDKVNAGSGWAQIANVTIGTDAYAQYTKDGATLQVDLDVDRSGIAVMEMSLSVLDGTNGFRLDGVDANDRSGWPVASAGDVNGDGYDDVIVGGMYGGAVSRTSYVVYGGPGSASSVDLSALDGTNGFRLDGINGSEVSGGSVASAGDVNDDGYADIIIGAVHLDFIPGDAYVVFGGAGLDSSIDLLALDGTDGFRLNTIDFYNPSDQTSNSAASAGDVNGDGYDDLIVGMRNAAGGAGQSYVVFGGASFAASMNLSDLDGANGFRLDGVSGNSGCSVASAGDVNGDGYADLVIGARGADGGAGESYVVYGDSSFDAIVALGTLDGNNGFRLEGIDAGDESGFSVASAGDVNGDGYADLIIGAPTADPGNYNAGESYVVFGGSGLSSSVDLSALGGSDGFRLVGVQFNSRSGASVASAGDVNGDGFDDILIGAHGAYSPPHSYSGQVYVVFGGASFGATVDLGALNGANGIRLDGIDANDRAGTSVSAAGDVNGDGYADIIIGAPQANPGEQSTAGESYVIYGGDFNGAAHIIGTASADTLTGDGGADVVRGGAGDDRIVIADAGFFDVDGGTGTDTLALAGSGISLDLTAIANSKITGIEAIDLTGSGNNSLTLVLTDVLNLSDTTNTLVVEGNSDDSVTVADGTWTDGGTGAVPGYHQYTLGAAMFLIDTEITSITIAT